MANTATTKKTPAKEGESKPTVVKDVPETTNTIQQENEALKAQMAQMQAQMEMLMKQVAVGAQVQPTQTPSSDKKIPFINLTRGTLVLRGSQLHSIDGQFAVRVFSEKEARAIVDKMNKAVRSGYVYIADADFVRSCELDDAYATMLSDADLKELLSKNNQYVIDAYKMVSDAQKSIILSMIIDRRKNGVPVDGNILVTLGELSGKDLVGIEKEE